MTALLAALCAVAVLLRPGGRPLPSVRAPGVRASAATPRPHTSESATGLRVRLRRLASTEVRRSRSSPGWVAEFAELSAVGLEAGLPSLEAARLACAVGAGTSARTRELGELIAAAEADCGRLGEALRQAAKDDHDLALLAAAWRLSEELGVASAPAARLTAEVLRERGAGAERRTVLAAGPRASMWLLTLLPLSGPIVALLLGLPVGDVYGHGVAGAAALAGLSLTGLGWAWSRRLLSRALRPAVVG
ncbi:hypothetical protein [Knoellia aerolata]|uniref:Type II secretion system protein GspF domain-containing protein n=1 Tax=Knoellia aerolata DSM 18566 TaxID=1385519 RepID=A0A0A0JA60_9MICO|nr:hypothetical protein [Knoellia aerolata]KGN33993.1 hypothetical protein N801_03850 [Knoellia aerolata DSM 18566]